jgi:hypothetical protein
MCAGFQLFALSRQTMPGARTHGVQRCPVGVLQRQLVLNVSLGEDAVSAFRSHDFETGIKGRPDADAYAVDPPVLQERLRR